MFVRLKKQHMKKIVLLLFVSIFYWGNCLHAQTQNALNFDNIDDNVNAPFASALITGSTQISLSMWVKPMNSNISFPDSKIFQNKDQNVSDQF